MRLTWRDGVATLFAALVGLTALAVTQSWGWPLLGSYRAGIVALALVGVPMCLIGGYAFWDSPAFKHPALILRDPFLIATSTLGFVAVGLIVAGLVSGTQAPFVGLAGVMGILWIIAPCGTRSRDGRGSTSTGRSAPASRLPAYLDDLEVGCDEPADTLAPGRSGLAVWPDARCLTCLGFLVSRRRGRSPRRPPPRIDISLTSIPTISPGTGSRECRSPSVPRTRGPRNPQDSAPIAGNSREPPGQSASRWRPDVPQEAGHHPLCPEGPVR
jgi:hypothetical protein